MHGGKCLPSQKGSATRCAPCMNADLHSATTQSIFLSLVIVRTSHPIFSQSMTSLVISVSAISIPTYNQRLITIRVPTRVRVWQLKADSMLLRSFRLYVPTQSLAIGMNHPWIVSYEFGNHPLSLSA